MSADADSPDARERADDRRSAPAGPAAGPDAILGRVADGVYACDRAWRYTYVNAAAERQVNRQRAALVGRVLWEAFPEAVDSPFHAAARRAEATGEPAHAETWFAPLATWFESTVYPAADGFTIVSRDVTARKRAETRLRILQGVTAKLMAAATAEAVAGVVLREGMRAAGAGASALYLRRDDRLDLVGAEGHDAAVARRYRRIPLDAAIPVAEAARTGEAAWFADQAARAARYPHLAAVFAAQPHQATAYVPFRHDGAVLGALNLSFPEPRAFDPDERAFLQALADLAAQALERADLHDKLDRANARFARAEAAAGAFSYEWDLATGRVERSANVAAVLGYDPGEIGPAWEDWAALIHPDDLRLDREGAIALLAAAPETGFGNEYRVRHRDGSWRWVQERTAVLRDAAGRVGCVVGHTIDASDRKRIEDDLREREHFLARVTATAPSVIYVYDLAADRNVYANRQLWEMLGYAPEEVQALGERFLPSLIHPVDWAETPAYIDRLVRLEDEQVLEREYRARHKDGSWRWLYGRETVFARDAEGRATQVLGNVLDITDRKRIEEALRESEARFREMADGSPFMVWVADEDANVQFVNRAYTDYFGVAAERVVGAGWRPLVHPEDAAASVASFAAALRDRRAWAGQFRARRADGAWRWIESSTTPRFGPGGEYLGAVGSSVDITERKRAEDALRESEGRFREMADSSPFMIWVTDDAANIQFVNQAYRAFFGVTTEQVTGPNWLPLIHPDDVADYVASFRAALRDRAPWTRQVRVRRADGAWRWIESRSNPRFSPSGAYLGAVGSSPDITERKEAEERLRASEARLAALLAQLPVGVGLTDRDGRWLLSNAMLRRYVGEGIPSRDPAGRTRWQTWDDRGQPIAPAQWPGARALRGEDVPGMDFLHTGDDGRQAWTRVSAAPFRDETGAVVGAISVVEDIDERKRAEAIARFLADAGEVLAGSLDEDETLHLVARLAVPDLADHCVVDLVDGGRPRPPTVVAAAEPGSEAAIRSLRERYPADPANPHSTVAAAIRSGEPQVVARLDDAQVDRITGDPRLSAAERGVLARSVLVAPLVARGRVLGVLSFGRREPGRYGPGDLAWAADLGRRCGLALDNARLYADRARSEQQLRLVTDALPVLVAYVDRGGRYRFNNRAYRTWFGRDPGEYLGRRVADGLGPAAHAAIAPHVAAALSGRQVTFTQEIPYADGGARHVEATYVPDVAPDGTVRGYVGLVADITQRVEADRRERERSERMRALAEVARDLAAARLDLPATLEAVAARVALVLGDGCVVRLCSADGDVLEPVAWRHPDPAVNDALADALAGEPMRADEGLNGRVAVTREPLVLPSLDAATLASARPAYRAFVERYGMGSVAVVPLQVDDRVLGTLMAWRDAAGRPYGDDDLAFLLALADRAALAIDNARLLRESREAESRVRRLFDAGVVGLMVADPERILEANDRFLAMVGFSRDDLAAGRLRWREMTPPDYRPLDERALGELAATGVCTPYEKEYARPDGSRVPVLIGGAMLDAPTPRSVSFVLDLSDQKALERLQQDFLATVSHDLKGPLTAILGQAQLLERRIARSGDPGLAEGLAEGTRRIAAAAERMAAMVDELVDVAQLRAGQALGLEMGPVDLAALAEACAAEQAAAAPSHRIRVEADAATAVTGDARRLRRVIDNLLGNAVKYSPDGGEVVLGVRRDDHGGRPGAVLTVRDDGVGIPAADLPCVFERFRRGHNAAAVARGSGIGLAGARQIVEQHGGSIAVESAVGRGSTFTVRLPLDGRGGAAGAGGPG